MMELWISFKKNTTVSDYFSPYFEGDNLLKELSNIEIVKLDLQILFNMIKDSHDNAYVNIYEKFNYLKGLEFIDILDINTIKRIENNDKIKVCYEIYDETNIRDKKINYILNNKK